MSSAFVDVVLKRPPGPDSDFVELEDADGHSISYGEWIDRKHGMWALRIPTASSLTFTYLRQRNVLRCETAFHKIEEWTLTDWLCATVGELGEAANVIKKLLRLRTSPQACRPGEMDEAALKAHLATELADTAIYLDLLAAAAGVDLGAAVVAKFNEVSDRLVCEVKL